MTAPCRTTDPATSRQGPGEKARSVHSAWVLRALAEALAPVTDERMCVVARRLGYQGTDQSLRSRRADLWRKGHVLLVGTGVNKAGRTCRTWTVPSAQTSIFDVPGVG